MAFRLYITPAVGTGTDDDPRRPKYFDGLSWAAMDYGFQPLFLVAADLTATQDSAIVANADVFAFPFDLRGSVGGGNVNAAQTALETALIPAQWVNGSMIWQQVARTVAGMFQFMQRLNVILGNVVLIENGAKLNVQWSTLPANIQQAILEAATSLGYTINPAANTQLRAVLKDLADQWGARLFQLNTFVF